MGSGNCVLFPCAYGAFSFETAGFVHWKQLQSVLARFQHPLLRQRCKSCSCLGAFGLLTWNKFASTVGSKIVKWERFLFVQSYHVQWLNLCLCLPNLNSQRQKPLNRKQKRRHGLWDMYLCKGYIEIMTHIGLVFFLYLSSVPFDSFMFFVSLRSTACSIQCVGVRLQRPVLRQKRRKLHVDSRVLHITEHVCKHGWIENHVCCFQRHHLECFRCVFF